MNAVLLVCAPDVALGRPIAITLQQVRGLTAAASDSYESIGSVRADGFTDLGVGVEDPGALAASEGSRPLSYYRVTSVHLRGHAAQAAQRAEEGLVSLLGAPAEVCWKEFGAA